MSLYKMSLSIAAAIIGLAATGPMVRAQYTATLQQVGPDVVVTGSGTLDLSALGSAGFGPEQGFLNPSFPAILVGGLTAGESPDIYEASFSGPSNFGSGGGIGASTSSGSIVGLFDSNNIVLGSGNLDVPTGYVSGTFVSGSSTFSGQSLSSLGITPGTYTWTWGSGPEDSFTLIALPEPASLGLLGLGSLSLLGRRRRA